MMLEILAGLSDLLFYLIEVPLLLWRGFRTLTEGNKQERANPVARTPAMRRLHWYARAAVLVYCTGIAAAPFVWDDLVPDSPGGFFAYLAVFVAGLVAITIAFGEQRKRIAEKNMTDTPAA